jgi:hypothetical protein
MAADDTHDARSQPGPMAGALAALDPRNTTGFDPDDSDTALGRDLSDEDRALLAQQQARLRADEARQRRSVGGDTARVTVEREENDDDLPEFEAESELEAMLAVQPPTVSEITAVINMPQLARRLSKKAGRRLHEFHVTIRALTEKELEQCSERAQRDPTAAEKEGGARGKVRDPGRFNRLVVAEAIVSPDLKHPALLKHTGPTPEHAVMQWFLTGEIDRLADEVTDLSGYSLEAVRRVGKS